MTQPVSSSPAFVLTERADRINAERRAIVDQAIQEAVEASRLENIWEARQPLARPEDLGFLIRAHHERHKKGRFERLGQDITTVVLSFLPPEDLQTYEIASRRAGYQFTDAGRAWIAKFKVMTSKPVRWTFIQESRKCLPERHLKHALREVTSLQAFVSDITNDDLAWISDHCPELAHLTLFQCWRITDAGLANLTRVPLTSLELSYCEKLTHVGLSHFVGMPLTSLNLRGCKNLTTDEGLAQLVGIPSLTFLDLSRSKHLTDEGLANLTRVPLNSLKLSYCENLTNAGLSHLAGMPLTFLDLSGCKNLTNEGLKYLAGMPLTFLDLSNCRNLTDEGVRRLAADLPQCRIRQ